MPRSIATFRQALVTPAVLTTGALRLRAPAKLRFKNPCDGSYGALADCAVTRRLQRVLTDHEVWGLAGDGPAGSGKSLNRGGHFGPIGLTPIQLASDGLLAGYPIHQVSAGGRFGHVSRWSRGRTDLPAIALVRCGVLLPPRALGESGLRTLMPSFQPSLELSQRIRQPTQSAGRARARSKRCGALEICRRIRRQTAMHLARNLVGQDLTFPAFEGVERRPHDFLGRTLWCVDIARKVSVDEACMQPDDLGALLRKFDAKAVGQRPCG